MKYLQLTKIVRPNDYGTLYSGNDINISVKDKIIENIKVYIPLNWEPIDIFAIYDTITGYMPNFGISSCIVPLPTVGADLHPYEILTKLEILLPYLRRINRNELDNTQIYLTNIDVHYDNNIVEIEVDYSKYRPINPRTIDLDVRSERTKLFNFSHLATGKIAFKFYSEDDNESIKEPVRKAINRFYGVPDNFSSFDAITDELKDTYVKKNHDYGNSFDKSIDKFGLTAAVVRMSDKMERLSSLMSKDAKVDESIRDTVMDLANYCIMTAMYLDNKKENK